MSVSYREALVNLTVSALSPEVWITPGSCHFDLTENLLLPDTVALAWYASDQQSQAAQIQAFLDSLQQAESLSAKWEAVQNVASQLSAYDVALKTQLVDLQQESQSLQNNNDLLTDSQKARLSWLTSATGLIAAKKAAIAKLEGQLADVRSAVASVSGPCADNPQNGCLTAIAAVKQAVAAPFSTIVTNLGQVEGFVTAEIERINQRQSELTASLRNLASQLNQPTQSQIHGGAP